MKICYASRVRSEATSRVISSRFVRPAHHSERIFQSPRFIQTGLSILRFQKGVVSPPQPPWRLLEAAKCSHVGDLTNPNTYLLVYLIYDYILIGWKFSFPQPPWRPLETAIHKLIKNCAIKKKFTKIRIFLQKTFLPIAAHGTMSTICSMSTMWSMSTRYRTIFLK